LVLVLSERHDDLVRAAASLDGGEGIPYWFAWRHAGVWGHMESQNPRSTIWGHTIASMLDELELAQRKADREKSLLAKSASAVGLGG